MSETQNMKPVPKDDEIDLSEIVRQLWAGRKIILYTTALFIILAGIYIFSKKLTIVPEYESTVTLYIESSSPEVLPTIITGAPFMSEMLKVILIHPVMHKPVTVLDVLKQFNPPQGNVAGMTGRVNAKTGKAGTLQITVMMQDSQIATQLADSIASKLSPFLINFHLLRSQKNLQYLAGRYRDAENAYLQSLKELSAFYDKNAGNLHGMDTITVKRLRAESDLKFDVYSELAQEIEKARIKEQEQAPIFNLLQPGTPARRANESDTKKTVMIMLFLGLICGGTFVLVKQYFMIR